MSCKLKIEQRVFSLFKKFEKKDKSLLEIINRKIKRILENPEQFKPLRAPLQNKRRVHIGKSFVLVYSFDKNSETVFILDFEHHDRVYKK
ncbi:MAG: type II toxin-antitoxin system RelE/ParE family toxin [Candidatus Nanoarchaeia archaeon]|nr:type II toxin-antitoxin system RelE/ParE family toxin [Candidatus Nanoarchaeia archaeon]